MEFAKQELAKYGWTEGMGLGREGSGITKALKPRLKFDTAGMGHDAAATFTNHWWEKAFNAAAENITVNKYVDGSVTLEAENSFNISEHKSQFKKKKHLVYDNFVMSATLTTEGGMTEEPQDAEEVPLTTTVVTLTDEELFKACGGRTAHKGARHGLGLSGKLARIEQQERLFMNLAEKVPENLPTSKRKKSKKSSDDRISCDMEFLTSESQEAETNDKDGITNLCSENILHVKKVKKSKKHKTDQKIEEIAINGEHLENNTKLKEPKRKRSERSADDEIKGSEDAPENNSNAGEIKRKKSKMSRKEKNESICEAVTFEECKEEKTSEERKRRKKSKAPIDTFIEEEVQVEKPSKKSKKKSIIADLEEDVPQRDCPVTDKKEKRKKGKRAVNEMLVSTTCNVDDSEKVEDPAPAKKKKKKSRK